MGLRKGQFGSTIINLFLSKIPFKPGPGHEAQKHAAETGEGNASQWLVATLHNAVASQSLEHLLHNLQRLSALGLHEIYIRVDHLDSPTRATLLGVNHIRMYM